MYELIQAGERTYYIECPAKMGLFNINDEEVCLIDSGNDKDAAKKALRIIEGQGWKLKMVINTHFHADHIGGNQLLQQRTGCTVCSRGSDRAFVARPLLEPAFLFGSCPPHELQNKFLMAKESAVTELTEELLPDGLDIIELPGHSDAQFGLRTWEDVVFLADCLVGQETLDKYRISHIFDVGRYLETLEMVKGLSAALFIPSHGAACTDIVPLAQANIDNTLEIMEDILDFCAEQALIFDDIMAALFEKYSLRFDLGQYVLNGTTVKAMLTYLHENGRMEIVTERNYIKWKTAVCLGIAN